MKLVSKLALAFSLTALSAAPSMAAKEEKQAEKAVKPMKLKLSPAFSAAYKPGVTAYETAQKAKDKTAKDASLATAKAAWPSIKAAATTDDDKYQAAIFADTLAVQMQDPALRKEAVGLFLSSATTPAADRPIYVYQSGVVAYADKDYPTAQRILLESYQSGYRADNIESYLSDLYSVQGNQVEAANWLKKHIEAATAANKPVDPKLYARGMNFAMKAKDAQEVAYWSKLLITKDPRPETYHDAIFQFNRFTDLNEQETLDLLRLARKTGSLLFEQEYIQYLQAVDKRRYPAEALAVLDEGEKKGIISKGNTTFSEIKTEANGLLGELKAGRAADEAAAKAAPKGYLALLNGDAALSFGDYAKAKELYEIAQGKGGLTDNQGADQTDRLLTHLAIAKVNLGDFAGAKADLQKLTGANRKSVGEFWSIYIDQQLAPKTAAPAPAS